MTPTQLRKLRGKRTQAEAAELTGYHVDHYRKLETGRIIITERVGKWLKAALK